MKWEPIETAPKDGTLIDLWLAGPHNNGERQPDCWWEHGQWQHDYGRDGVFDPEIMQGDIPTHWMPRPEPPAT